MMNLTPIKVECELSEDTRLSAINYGAGNGIYDLHCDDVFYYVTKHGKYDVVYAVFSKEFYEFWFS